MGQRRGMRLQWRSLLFIIAVALIGSTLLKSFVFQAFYVPSGSMKNTLQISDRFVATRLGHDIEHGDIVVFYDAAGWMAESEDAVALRKSAWTRFLKMSGIVPSQNNEVMVKRVIGLPGDHIVCCSAGKQITVNGVAIREPYLPNGMQPSDISFDVVVPEGSLFLMGDNRSHSADSRRFLNHESHGFVREADVIGRAVATIWPPSHITIHHRQSDLFSEAENH
jgi:signal peptidase I